MIRTERLSKVTGRRTVLSEITFAVEKGDAVSLAGPPGSGKSTLLRILATLTQATSGRVEIAGIDVTTRPFDARKKVFLSGGVGLGCHDMKVLEYLRLVSGWTRPEMSPRSVKVSSACWRWLPRWPHGPRCSCSTSRSPVSICRRSSAAPR
jgi:ABC-type multidrug transport system ATPase subunit